MPFGFQRLTPPFLRTLPLTTPLSMSRLSLANLLFLLAFAFACKSSRLRFIVFFCLVLGEGLEPPRYNSTGISVQRVYQFHHPSVKLFFEISVYFSDLFDGQKANRFVQLFVHIVYYLLCICNSKSSCIRFTVSFMDVKLDLRLDVHLSLGDLFVLCLSQLDNMMHLKSSRYQQQTRILRSCCLLESTRKPEHHNHMY